MTGITKDGKRVTGVETATGETVRAEYVVNCAGMWARQFGEICGVNIPNQAAEHYYLLTEAMDAVRILLAFLEFVQWKQVELTPDFCIFNRNLSKRPCSNRQVDPSWPVVEDPSNYTCKHTQTMAVCL